MSISFSPIEPSFDDYSEYLECVNDLINHEAVQSMRNYTQHRGTTVLEHSLVVSYLSFRISKSCGLDYRSAARGGLLHDFFLYQRRVNKPTKGLHTLDHPKLALKNATELYELNEREKDIIVKHMWPLCVGIPHYSESMVVSMVDKYCCTMEFFKLFRTSKAQAIEEYSFALQTAK